MSNSPVEILFTNLTRFRYATDECIAMIHAASPDVKVTDITDLVEAELSGNTTAAKELDGYLSKADIIFGTPHFKNVAARSPKLKWIYNPFAGVEKLLTPDVVESSVIITNSSGMHSQVAELVMAMMLMFAKRARLTFASQQQRKWEKVMPEVLEYKTVGILGLGHIGQDVARFSKAFRMRIIGMRSKPKPTHYADEVLPPERLPEILSQSDFVVIGLPHTPETDKFIGIKELRMMKPSAFLINIARGRIIDEDALVQALRENWIAGAGLDVAATEPLPSESPLWDFENVIITPHIGGPMVTYMQKATKVFNENLKRYLAGKKLHNIVNKKKGY